MIPHLDRLINERNQAEKTITDILAQVGEDRDLSDAEMLQVNTTRERIDTLDAQIGPLEDLQSRMDAHAATARAVTSTVADEANDRKKDTNALTVRDRAMMYASIGNFIVDYIRAVGYQGAQMQPDHDAAQRVTSALGRDVQQDRAISNQTTADTPGLLPQPIIGEVLNEIDGARPMIGSLSKVGNFAGIPGKTFDRPYVSQHTKVGEQTSEKSELVSRQFKVLSKSFTKRTFGGTLNVSRQDIDWTSPAAWDMLVSDLIFEYQIETDDMTAASFASGVTQTAGELAANAALKDWVANLYKARTMAATANATVRSSVRRMPNKIWLSEDMDDTLGVLIETTNVSVSTNKPLGSTSLAAYGGSMLQMPRVMVPGLPDGTVIVGRDNLYEFYEERIGLLQAIEPKILGIEVAYGGYAAFGFLDATAFVKITKAA